VQPSTGGRRGKGKKESKEGRKEGKGKERKEED